jgi:hypothetical protein
MRKLILAAVAATALFALLAGPAAARTGLVAEPRTTTLTIGSLRLNGGLSTVVCPITLTVTLHESVPKIRGTLAGFATVTDGTGSCSAGNSGLLVGGSRVTGPQGPYHVNYISFEGTLPNITAVTLEVLQVSFWITEPVFRISCLTAEPQNITGTSTGGNPATGMEVRGAGIRLEGGFGCRIAEGSMEGSGSLSTAVTMSLI